MEEIVKEESERCQGQACAECLIKGQVEEEGSSKSKSMSNWRRNEDNQGGLNHGKLSENIKEEELVMESKVAVK